jgi:DNA-binding XRE family transcriptional regulator
MRVEQEYAIFGQVLKKHRKKKKYSQGALGKLVDLNRASIANIESGNQRVMFRDALILAKTLDFSLDEVKMEVAASKLEARLSQQPSKVKIFLEKIITDVKGGV